MTNYTGPKLPNPEDISNSDASELNDIDTAIYNGFNSTLGGVVVKGVYESSAQAIAKGHTLFTHGLGKKPTLAVIHLICTSAEHGYSIGDKVIPSVSHHGVYGSWHMIYIPGDETTTKIGVVLGRYLDLGDGTFSVVEQATNTAVAIDDSKWQWYLSAYALNDSDTDIGYYTLQADATGTTDVDTYNNIGDEAETAFGNAETDIASGDYFKDQLTESYASSALTIVAGASAALAHSLTPAPTLVAVNITCTSADLGYAVGDVVCISHQPGYQDNVGVADYWGVTIESDTTNITYWIGTGGITVAHNTSFENQDIDPTKWTMIIKAWA